jgi:hypothetical protein
MAMSGQSRLPLMPPSQPGVIALSRSGVTTRDAVRASVTWLMPPSIVTVAWVVSRALVIVAAIVAETLIPRNPLLVPGDTTPILASLTSWDGWYYLGIARDGYQAVPVSGDYSNVAFPPLYPMLVRLLAAPIPGSEGMVAIAVSNLAFLVGLGLLVRLGTPHVGRRRAILAAVLLAIHPFASAFAMAYTESLFLMLMVGAFLAAERRLPAAAGILLGLATLCRLQGLALVVPLFIVLVRQEGWRVRPSQLWLLLGPLAAAAFVAYLAWLTGSSTAYLDAQQAWGRAGIGAVEPGGTVAALFSPYQAALLVTLLASVYLFVFIRQDRIRIEYAMVPGLFILAELSSGSLEAVGRITMAGFPLVWILASRRALVSRRIWPLVSVALSMAIALLSFGGYWVP